MIELFQAINSKDLHALAQMIIDGKFNIDQIMNYSGGRLDDKDKAQILALVSNPAQDPDDRDFEAARSQHTIPAYQDYLSKYPYGKHRAEAYAHIQALTPVEPKDPISSGPIPSVEPPKNPDPAPGIDPETKNHMIKAFLKRVRKTYDDKIINDAQRATAIVNIVKEIVDIPGISIDDIYALIRQDKNIFNAPTVKALLDEGLITKNGLLTKGGIKYSYILSFDDFDPNTSLFSAPAPLDRIKLKSTEIYFWGLPSSGKSCIIGGVMNLFTGGGLPVNPEPTCNGYAYLNEMMSRFGEDGVITLPAGTPLESCYEMGFTIKDDKGKTHPITIIDMAGELLRAMYVKMTRPDELDDRQRQALDTADKILSKNASNNHKIHFFVVEYGAENLTYERLGHLQYLNVAMDYLKQQNVFKKLTDAIYIVISKADKAPYDTSNKQALASQFSNYIGTKLNSFVARIDDICKTNYITKTNKIVFSLGEVCMQNFCTVDKLQAQKILRIMLDATGTTYGKWFRWM